MTTTTRARLTWPRSPCPTSGCRTPSRCCPPTSTPSGSQRLRAAMDARGYDHLVVWADREHSANLAYLSGFDPRFEEALLVVGTSGDPAVLVGNECEGMAAAAPLPMRVGHVPGLQPARPAARRLGAAALDPARRGDPRRRAGSASSGWKTYATAADDRGAGLPRRRAPRRGRRERGRGERDRPPDRPGRRAAGRQRGRPARRVRVGRVPDVRRRAPRDHRAAARDDRARLRAAAGVERHAVVMPPDAHGRATGAARAAQPG